MRMRHSFEAFLHKEVEAGQLEVPDVSRAASQFFAMLKGELHARLLCGCVQSVSAQDIGDHVQATVDTFLRAFTPRRVYA